MLQFSNGGLVFFKEKNQFLKKREMQMDENGDDDHTCVGQSIINTINDTCVHLEFTLESLKLREIPTKPSKYMHV
jgi:hypothetical protein